LKVKKKTKVKKEINNKNINYKSSVHRLIDIIKDDKEVKKIYDLALSIYLNKTNN